MKGACGKGDIVLELMPVIYKFVDFFELYTFGNLIRLMMDISIVSFVIYKFITVIRDTRAYSLIKGIFVLLIAAEIAELLKLEAVTYILTNTMTYGVYALLIVFQPEMRRALEKIGRNSFMKMITFSEYKEDQKRVIAAVTKAAKNLSKSKTGALIVIEGDTKLGDIIKTGITLNCDVNSEILENIFVPNTPLHDGAVIIRDGKIAAAGCFLPLTENYNIRKDLGTRHRAAMGISENSDAIVVVVSEETGIISTAVDGELKRRFNQETLTFLLEENLIGG